MGDETTLDDQAIVARIRDRLRSSLLHAPLPAVAPRPRIQPDTSAAGIDAELAAIHAAADICDVGARSHRAVLGPILSLANKVARKVLAPSLERQVSYNQATDRLLQALHAQLETVEAEQQALRRRCEALENELRAVRGNVGTR
jgi:hypothetical protein